MKLDIPQDKLGRILESQRRVGAGESARMGYQTWDTVLHALRTYFTPAENLKKFEVGLPFLAYLRLGQGQDFQMIFSTKLSISLYGKFGEILNITDSRVTGNVQNKLFHTNLLVRSHQKHAAVTIASLSSVENQETLKQLLISAHDCKYVHKLFKYIYICENTVMHYPSTPLI